MIEFNSIRYIRKDAMDSILLDSSGERIQSRRYRFIFYFFVWVLPILFMFLPWFISISFDNIKSYIGTSIAVFIALFFSLLLIIGDKIRNEKTNENKDNNNFKKYKENMRQIAKIVLYIILIGIYIFLLMFIHTIYSAENETFEKVITSLSLFFIVQFMVVLISLIQRFSYVIRDEIENIF